MDIIHLVMNTSKHLRILDSIMYNIILDTISKKNAIWNRELQQLILDGDKT